MHSTTLQLTPHEKSSGRQTNPRMEPSFKNFELFLLFGWPGGGVSVNMVYVTFLLFTNVYIYYFWLVSFSFFLYLFLKLCYVIYFKYIFLILLHFFQFKTRRVSVSSNYMLCRHCLLFLIIMFVFLYIFFMFFSFFFRYNIVIFFYKFFSPYFL